MNFKTFLVKYSPSGLLGAYALFLASLALELEVNIARTILLVAFAAYAVAHRELPRALYASSLLKFAALFPVIAAISWILSPYDEANGLKTFDWLMCLIFGMATTLIWGRRTILLLLLIPAITLLAALGTAVWNAASGLPVENLFTPDNKLILFIGTANRLGFLLATGAAICIGTLFMLGRMALPLFLAASTLSVLCWLAQSRAAVFGLFGVILTATGYSLVQNRKSPLALALVLLVAALIGFGSIFATDRIMATLSSPDMGYLLNGRDDIWLAAWEIFLKSPMVGFGVDSFHEALAAHLALPENADRFPAIRSQYVFWNAHQMVLGILCETGLAGLAVFCVLIVRGIRAGIRFLPETFPPLLMLIAFLVHGIGGYGFHRSWNSAFFFLALGILEGWNLLNVNRRPLQAGSE